MDKQKPRVIDYSSGQQDTRPWGHWEILFIGPNFVVKRLTVIPGARLSLQRHRFRQETWTVVEGTAEVTLEREVFRRSAGDCVQIRTGETHRLANPGTIPLVCIEVQSGEHLYESDIERLEDDYNRIEKRNSP